jgi:hypothetical protein
MILTTSIWADQTHRRKIGAISACISGEQRQFHNGGMGTDKKIRQRKSPFTESCLVFKKCLARQKKSLFGDVEQNEPGGS